MLRNLDYLILDTMQIVAELMKQLAGRHIQGNLCMGIRVKSAPISAKAFAKAHFELATPSTIQLYGAFCTCLKTIYLPLNPFLRAIPTK